MGHKIHLASRSSRPAPARAALTLAILLGALFATGPAAAALREFRVMFEPSPSSTAAGYTMHIGLESGGYTNEFDLGSPPATGGTVVYAVDLEDSVDLYVAMRAYDADGVFSPFSNEFRVAAVDPPPAEDPPPAAEDPPPAAEDPPPAEDPPAEEPPPAEDPAPGSGGGSLDLDNESGAVVRSVLEETVVRMQGERSLYVAPGVVEAAATVGRVRIVFDLAPSMTSEREARTVLEALFSGSGSAQGAAVWDGLRIFPTLGLAAADMGPEALRRLLETDFVERIEGDVLHSVSLDSSIPLTGADVAQQAGWTGEGQVIAFLDTGIDAVHPMLAGRVLDEACFSTTGSCPNGQTEMFGPGAGAPCTQGGCGHGTRVAGVAAGSDAAGGLRGVAPDAQLISIQVFSEVDGALAAYTSDILAGLQHVLSLSSFYDVAVVTLALGSDPYASEVACDEAGGAQRMAVQRLRDAGVLTVAAAGNDSLTNALSLPACLSNVVGVGSVSDADRVSSFSNSASFLSLFAPGAGIETADPMAGTAVASGTSMAVAHVAGAVASVRQAVPAARVGEVQNALSLSGEPVRDARNGFTIPRLNVAAAVAMLSPDAAGGSSGAPGTVPLTGGDASSSGGGASSTCGLIGIEPFLVLPLVRILRRRRELGGALC